MYSFRLFRYYTAFHFLYLVCEVIFVVFVAQLINGVGHQVHRDHWIYFTSFWNFADLLLISFSLVNIALYAVRLINLTSAIEAIRDDPNAFYGFLSVAFYDELIAYISCIIFVIPCLQFLQFLKFNKNFMIFYATPECEYVIFYLLVAFLVEDRCWTFQYVSRNFLQHDILVVWKILLPNPRP